MNFTNKASVRYRIAAAIYKHGPMTVEQLSAQMPEVDLKGLRTTVGRMCFGGDLSKEGETFKLHQSIHRHFDSLEPREIAEYRTFSVQRPLNLSRLPSLEPRREGSGEYRAWNSHFARLA